MFYNTVASQDSLKDVSLMEPYIKSTLKRFLLRLLHKSLLFPQEVLPLQVNKFSFQPCFKHSPPISFSESPYVSASSPDNFDLLMSDWRNSTGIFILLMPLLPPRDPTYLLNMFIPARLSSFSKSCMPSVSITGSLVFLYNSINMPFTTINQPMLHLNFKVFIIFFTVFTLSFSDSAWLSTFRLAFKAAS